MMAGALSAGVSELRVVGGDPFDRLGQLLAELALESVASGRRMG